MFSIQRSHCGHSGTSLSREEQNYILQHCLNNNIIEIADVDTDEILNMKKRQEMLAKNKSEPWQGNDGYWRAYVYDESKSKGRRLIKKKNKKDLEDAIIAAVEQNEKITINDLFEEYVERKVKNDGIKPATVTRYKNVFARHYIETGWDKKDIRKISLDQLSDFLEDEIGRNSLNSKALSSLKGITKGMLIRAKKKQLINYSYQNVFDNVDARPEKKYVDNDSQIFLEDERKALMRYIENNPDVMNLAILFMGVSGLRVGEMVALKWSDFTSSTRFTVSRTETFYKAENGQMVYEVVDRTKTKKGTRTLRINEAYSWIVEKLRKLNPFSEYVCTDSKGNRIRAYQLRNRIYYICKKLPEIPQLKSPHKLRKTLATELLDNHVDNNFIINMLGHVNISTTENNYHYDKKSEEEKQKIINNIFPFKQVANE